MISMRMASCSSPRPETRNVSGESVSSTRMPRLSLPLLHQALAELRRGDVLALLARERRHVGGEEHRDGRLVDADQRQRDRVLERRPPSRRCRWSSMPAMATISPALRLRDLDALQALVAVEHGDLRLLDRCRRDARPTTRSACFTRAVDDAADDEPADVVVPVQHGHAELQADGGIEARRRHRLQDGLEERLQRGAGRP